MFGGNAARDWPDAKEKQHMSLCVHLGRCLPWPTVRVRAWSAGAVPRRPRRSLALRKFLPAAAGAPGPWRLEARPAGRGTPMMAHETCCGLVSWVWTLPDQVAGQAKAFYSSIQGLLHCKGMYGSIQSAVSSVEHVGFLSMWQRENGEEGAVRL
jgi:hypothetical protein